MKRDNDLKNDINSQEEVMDIKKVSIKKIILWVLFTIVSVVGLLFLSTEIRWKADIEDRKEIVYIGQSEIKIDKVVDFYGVEVDTELEDNEALLLYCTSEYGGDCLTGDYNNGLENILRNSNLVVNIVLIIDLLLLFLIFKDKEIKKIFKVIISVLVFCYGVYNLGVQVYYISDYYLFVNDSENVVNATIVRGIITASEKEFNPLVEYETEKGKFLTYLDYPIDGKIDEKVNEQITIYYDTKDHSIINIKRNVSEYILPIIISLIFMGLGIIYFILNREYILKKV